MVTVTTASKTAVRIVLEIVKKAEGQRGFEVLPRRWVVDRAPIVLDHRLPLLVDERYTIADIARYAYTHVADEVGFDLARYPAIAGWLERAAAQPGHVPITA